MSSDNAKPRATTLPRLEWQGELDSAMAEIDDRLTHPRRRASDRTRQALVPELGQTPITTELIDEIAWRVAQQIRANGEAATAETVTKALEQRPARPQSRKEIEEPVLQPGKILMIRFKLPLLPWPLRLLQRRSRKKQHPLTTARLRA
jgi:hypothetical protein